MDLHDTALVAAGAIGSAVSIVHGVLTERYMVRPLVDIAGKNGTPPSILRLVPVLLHFSTFVWLLGGLALIAAALRFGPQARLTTIAFVGACYAFAAIGNCWATRGRHPGWMLMALAVVLIAVAAAR